MCVRVCVCASACVCDVCICVYEYARACVWGGWYVGCSCLRICTFAEALKLAYVSFMALLLHATLILRAKGNSKFPHTLASRTK